MNKMLYLEKEGRERRAEIWATFTSTQGKENNEMMSQCYKLDVRSGHRVIHRVQKLIYL